MSGLFFGLAFGLRGLTNMVPFCEAFGVKPSDKMDRGDEVRVKIGRARYSYRNFAGSLGQL